MCATSSSPGDYANVLTVGSTDYRDELARRSSKGPSRAGLVKPEVSTPGVGVRSAWNTGDSEYNTISGTSMAATHVSGVVALLLSVNKSLQYEDVKFLLTTTADTATLKPTGYKCGGTQDGVFPNNVYGFGRVNAFSAYKKATAGAPLPAPTVVAPPPAPTTATPNRCVGLDFWECVTTQCAYNYDEGTCHVDE